VKYLPIALLIISCADDAVLNKICGNVIQDKCYAVWYQNGYKDPNINTIDEAKSLQRMAESQVKKNGTLSGSCKLGTPICENDEIVDCVGAVYPEEKDECDGIDNNCNGVTDEDALFIQSQHFNSKYPKLKNPCIDELGSTQGMCKYALIKCINGEFVCTDANNVNYHIEPNKELSCDGIDNDCDGQIDEDLFVGESCYGIGDPDDIWEYWWTAANPPCHSGIKKCIMGVKSCVNQELPKTDDYCGDYIDNDCNGIIDDSNYIKASKIDYVFIVDRSGSMCPYYHNVGGAANAFVQTANPNYRYAIVETTSFSPNVSVISDFTDIDTISTKLLSLDCFGSGSEETYGGLLDTCNIENNPLNLNWDPEAIPIILDFTDEDGQSHIPYNTMAQQVIDMCINNNVLVFVWSHLSSYQLKDVTLQIGGAFFELVANTQQLFDDISSIVLWLCE